MRPVASPCSCQKMVAPSNQVLLSACSGPMIEFCIGRLLLGWMREIGRRHRRFPLVPVIPGSAELIPGSAEKFPVRRLQEFLCNRLIQRMIFAKIDAFEAESKKFPVKFPIVPGLRVFRSAEAGLDRLTVGERPRVRRPPCRSASANGSPGPSPDTPGRRSGTTRARS